MRLSRHAHDDDHGAAMIIAIIVLMVITTLALGGLARSLSGLQSSRHNQDFTGALASADSGVSDGLYRLDQQGTNTAAGACGAASAPTTCTVNNVGAVSGTAYTLNVLSESKVRIRSKGVTNGVPHAVEAYAVRDVAFPYALFGTDPNDPSTLSLDFNGNSSPITATDNGPAAIGSNGGIDCGNHTPANQIDLYAGGSVSKCGSVPTINTINATYNPLPPQPSCPVPSNNPPTPCVPSSPSPLPCPAGGLFSGTVAPGTYVCNQAISFGDVGTIASPGVKVYVFTTTQPAIDLGSGCINGGVSGNNCTAGDPRNLQIYVNGTASDVTNGNHGFTFVGVLWAPNVSITSNGCKASYVGSIIVNGLRCNGAPHWTFTYDARLRTMYSSGWRIQDYTEMPSKTFGTP